MKDKIILSDVDGVLLAWEYAFDTYLQQHGFTKVDGGQFKYDIGKRYGIDQEQGVKLIKLFNESAAIGFLPALRDSMYYVKKLTEKHGYKFHAITSLSKNKNAQELRKMNLRKLFGKQTFEKFLFLDTGADKDAVLEKYRGTGCWWIEDKTLNAEAGLAVGLNSIIIEHGHNLDYNHPKISKVKNWQEIYQLITGEEG
jgi:FMN phosphatase YigB (HAD superfamily)